MCETNPDFAIDAGLLALRWLAEGHGYEITGLDVVASYSSTMKAAERSGTGAATRERVNAIIASETGVRAGFVRQLLGRELMRP